MPRRARLSLPGIPWHIIQRANNHSACFYTERDYTHYLDTLKEQSLKTGCQIHAYVLMSNHVHLLVTPEKQNSAALMMMKGLGQRYVQYINRSYQRSGTLWDGRFKSCLAQDEDYVMACYRYIELNPVRAGMVEHPRDYRWSSYQVNAENQLNDLITPHAEFLSLAQTKEARNNAYRALFLENMAEPMLGEIRRSTNGNYVLGSTGFQQEISEILNRRVVPGKAGRPIVK